MALTRKLLKGMGLTEEQMDSIIDAHTDTTDALKQKIEQLEEAAGKAADLEKQLKALQSGTDWKAEHDKVKKEFDQYKAEMAGKEESAKVRSAYRELLKAEEIDPNRFDVILRAEAENLKGAKLGKDGKLENAEALAKGIRENWGDFRVKTETRGTNPATPPSGGRTAKTREEIMAIKDTAERQQAIAQNLELFGG